VSSRSGGALRRLSLVVVVVVSALAAALPGAAVAKKAKHHHYVAKHHFAGKHHLTAKQRAKIRRQLRLEIRRHPKVLRTRSFLRRASLVDFTLPVTLALRTGDDPATSVDESATRNPNLATLDLGTSLGQREVDLGGRLAAEIQFSDSYDGGALGNVKITILPSATKTLETTSIPLIWNDRVWSDSTTRWDANAVNDLIMRGQQVTVPGCGDFDSSTSDLSKAIAGNLIFARGYEPVIGGPGLPGYPLNKAADGSDPAPGQQNFDPDNPNIPEGFLPNQSGIDTPTLLKADRNVGDPMALGGNPSPFPSGSAPGGFQQPPSVADTVLRTAPLTLQVAPPGTSVNMTGDPAQGGDPNGVNGSQNILIGKSGGEANLFGRIPGKAYGIDVTASFATRVSSIIRIVDQDLTGRNLIEGEPWPAGVFGCRQIFTGFVDNYIPGIHLKGNLQISPAITRDGQLRIAKATVSSEQPARFPVAACVVPMSSFQVPNSAPGENRPDAPAGSYSEYDDNLPSPFSTGVVLAPLDPILYPQYNGALEPESELPVDLHHYRAHPPARPCNTNADRIVQMSAMPPITVGPQVPAQPSDGYTTSASGATISVAADLDVQNVSIDVLLGDAPVPPSAPASPSSPGSGLPLIGGILDAIPALLPPFQLPSVTPPVPSSPLPSSPLPSSPLPSSPLPSSPLPSSPLPSSPLPSSPLPSSPLPSSPLPSSPLPSSPLPSSPLPSEPLPSSPLPSSPLPSEPLPSSPLPSSPLPSSPLPSSPLPSSPLPGFPFAPIPYTSIPVVPTADTTIPQTRVGPLAPQPAEDAGPSVFTRTVPDPLAAFVV
jgi:hypothetical protein